MSSINGISSDYTYTINDAVNQIGFGKFQIKLLFVVALHSVCESIELNILAILTSSLHCSWGLSYWEGAIISIVVFLGTMFGSLFFGFLSDKYGRKKSLILSAWIIFYYGLLSAFSPNFFWIVILRGLVGFGLGCFSQGVAYCSEICPTNKRVISSAIISVAWTIGSSCEVVLALFIMPTYGWRWLLGLSSLPLILFIIASTWLPESVRFDTSSGNIDGAAKTLARMCADNKKAMPQGSLTMDDPKEVQRGRLIDLFVPELRLTTSLLFIIWPIGSLSYFGILLMSPGLIGMSDICSTGKISSHASCHANCQNLQAEDYLNLLWTTVAELPGIAITILLTEFIGRKRTLCVGYICFSIFMFIISTCSLSHTWLVFALFGARGILFGALQTQLLYTAEIYPTTLRATGLGACTGMAKIGAMITPIIAQVILQQSVPVSVGIYGSLGIVAALASFCLPTETKGRELKESHVPM